MDFGVGYSEIAVILVIALIVIGPRRLPELMRTFGKVMGQLRRMSDDLRREILFSDDIRDLRQTMTNVVNPLAAKPAAPPPVPPKLKLKPPASAAETPAADAPADAGPPAGDAPSDSGDQS